MEVETDISFHCLSVFFVFFYKIHAKKLPTNKTVNNKKKKLKKF